ncbi:type II-A CRISPR-associated protein Csn2 [Paratractidigestivibacter sp.]|uniref:type II-A CRISPR-associated protein Csn2 n=1 Tax=Paratractidigestivibacter sp. TaxID=2847316 RepID=UPI003AB89ACB
MRLVFSGLESPVEVMPGRCSTIEVENQTLFTRIAQSLLSGEGRYATEPFSIWEGEDELRPKDTLLVIDNPLSLPWDDRVFMGSIVKRIEREYLEDEDLRRAVEELQRSIATRMMSLELGMNADLGFSLEWDLKRYLKFMGFGVSYQGSKSFLDNLLNFLSLALDSGDKRVIAFVNLKTFLSKNDFETFLEQLSFLKTKVLLLENKQDVNQYEYEQKRAIDLDFIES